MANGEWLIQFQVQPKHRSLHVCICFSRDELSYAHGSTLSIACPGRSLHAKPICRAKCPLQKPPLTLKAPTPSLISTVALFSISRSTTRDGLPYVDNTFYHVYEISTPLSYSD